MSYYPESYENRTGLTRMPDSLDEASMSDATVKVNGKTLRLTKVQEQVAQDIATNGVMIELPHNSGRRVIRQRALDIARERAGMPAAKPKSKTDYVFVIEDNDGRVTGVRRTMTEAKSFAQENAGMPLTWDNYDKSTQAMSKQSGRGYYAVTRMTLPKTPVKK